MHNTKFIYCILRGRVKGYNNSITTIICQGGSYRTMVGYSLAGQTLCLMHTVKKKGLAHDTRLGSYRMLE